MDIYNDVADRLARLGYIVSSPGFSDPAVEYAINLAAEKIKSHINRSEIPDGLKYTWIDMSAGLFLFDLKSSGQLGDGFDFSQAVKRISEGDVSVEYAGESDGSSTPESRFDNLINSLINPPACLFSRYRRLVW